MSAIWSTAACISAATSAFGLVTPVILQEQNFHRRGVDLFVGGRRLEASELSDVPAHDTEPKRRIERAAWPSITRRVRSTSCSSRSTGPRPATRPTWSTSRRCARRGSASRADDQAWVAIITGVGEAFFAGADLKTYVPEITKFQKRDRREGHHRDRRLPARRRHPGGAAQLAALQAGDRGGERLLHGGRHGDARRLRHPRSCARRRSSR